MFLYVFSANFFSMNIVLKSMFMKKLQPVIFYMRLSVINLSSRDVNISLRGNVMQRREAIRLFREVCECIPDAYISGISLSPNRSSTSGFDLRINVTIDSKSLTNVQSVASKHGMVAKEDRGSILIYGSQTRSNCVEIMA